MIVGVLKEVDKNENRVAISPEVVKKLNTKKDQKNSIRISQLKSLN